MGQSPEFVRHQSLYGTVGAVYIPSRREQRKGYHKLYFCALLKEVLFNHSLNHLLSLSLLPVAMGLVEVVCL